MHSHCTVHEAVCSHCTVTAQPLRTNCTCTVDSNAACQTLTLPARLLRPGLLFLGPGAHLAPLLLLLFGGAAGLADGINKVAVARAVLIGRRLHSVLWQIRAWIRSTACCLEQGRDAIERN